MYMYVSMCMRNVLLSSKYMYEILKSMLLQHCSVAKTTNYGQQLPRPWIIDTITLLAEVLLINYKLGLTVTEISNCHWTLEGLFHISSKAVPDTSVMVTFSRVFWEEGGGGGRREEGEGGKKEKTCTI